MNCSLCHREITLDITKVQGYMWETNKGIFIICPRCICGIIQAHLTKIDKDLLIATPSEEVKPAIRKLDIDE